MGRAAKEGGTFIDFLKDMGDKKVRSPDSGNDVKLKSLKGDRGRKIQQAEFQKWLKKNEGKDDGGGGKEGEGRLNRLTGALGKGAASIKKFATDSSYRKEVFEAMKAKKGEAVKFAKAQAKQTKEMFETIKNIMEAPPVPSPDEKMKAKKQATNIGKILFLAVNQALPLPGTMPATLWVTSAVNKVFKSSFSWMPETWAKVGHKVSADEIEQATGKFLDELIKAFNDPKVLEEAIDAMIADAEKGGDKKASYLPGDEFETDNIRWADAGMIDHVLQGRTIEGDSTSVMQGLTQKSREAGAPKLPVVAGTRVQFEANLGSVLAYKDIPGDKMGGTVVTVRSADGDVTAYDGRVHVMWDDGQFRAIQATHLRLAEPSLKQASRVRRSFIEFGSISEMFTQAKTGSSDLVHKATKDLWSFSEAGGEFVIERLFSEDGNPLKV